MSIFLQRTALFLLVVIMQRSFLDVLWPGLVAPTLMITLIVSLVFLNGFENGGLWSLLALILFALLGEGEQAFLLYAVVIAYGTSFLSRRLVTERPLQTAVILALSSAGFAFVYALLFLLIENGRFDFLGASLNALQAALVFPFVFLLFRAWEGYIKNSFMSEFRGMRT